MSTDDKPSTTGQAAETPLRTFTILILYMAELQGLKFDHAALTKEAKAKGDDWYVTADEEVGGPLPLVEVFKLALAGKTVKVLHKSNSQDEAPAWRNIAYRALWSNPRAALIWTLLVHGMGAFLGWVFVCLITPFRFLGPAQLVYWIIAALVIVALCIPAEIRERVKDRFRKPKADKPPDADAES